ncbi:MAG: FeoB-associated Cys-rich membrane protein [Clostridiales bacterium]|jgi:hypothetical protein|nr:FeoB-associated Cys-rich membrane protein [Clostridiales bacterium]
MFLWISANIGTILVSLALLAVVTGIILGMKRDKKRGKSACGKSCGQCPMSGSCHKF